MYYPGTYYPGPTVLYSGFTDTASNFKSVLKPQSARNPLIKWFKTMVHGTQGPDFIFATSQLRNNLVSPAADNATEGPPHPRPQA